jgi:hypothetical protein
LRDSRPCLADEGWRNLAQLMAAAADEIERLNARVRELEDNQIEPPNIHV